MLARFWRGVEWVMEGALVVLVALMTLLCIAQVGFRYLLGDPLVWSEEAARYAFVWISYLSAWLAWKHRAHIDIDIVHYVPSKMFAKATEIFVEASIFLYCAYTFWTTLTLLSLTSRQPSPTLGFPMVYVYGGYSVMVALIMGDILVRRLSHKPLADDPVREVHSQ